MILQIKIEEAQNKFAIVSIVSFQIEVICIFSKRGVYKLIFEDFIHSNCFFVTITFTRLCAMVSKPNSISTFLSPRRWNLLKCLLFLRLQIRLLHPAVAGCDISDLHQRAAFHVLFPWFSSDGDLPVQFFSERLLWHRHFSGQPLQLRALYLEMVCTKPLSVVRFISESLSILCPIGQYMPSVSSL